MINEVNLSKSQRWGGHPYYRQVKQLVAARVGVEGIGFQFHFFQPMRSTRRWPIPAYEPRRLLDVYESFADFNLPLYVTEITIPTPPGAGEAAQAELAGNFYRLWFSSPGMAGITWWNLGDGTAVKGENQARGGLVDDNLEAKES